MAQWVKQATLNLGSDHDLMVHGFEPRVGLCTDGGEPARNSLARSLSLSAPPLLVLSPSLQNK